MIWKPYSMVWAVSLSSLNLLAQWLFVDVYVSFCNFEVSQQPRADQGPFLTKGSLLCTSLHQHATHIAFANNQLSPRLNRLSPLITTHPSTMQRAPVRPSNFWSYSAWRQLDHEVSGAIHTTLSTLYCLGAEGVEPTSVIPTDLQSAAQAVRRSRPIVLPFPKISHIR